MIDADSRVEYFENYDVDATFEIMFLTTMPEYNMFGIASHLGKHTIELAMQLKQGIDCEKYLKPGVPAPKLITCIASSPAIQKIAVHLKCDVLERGKVADCSPLLEKYIGNFEYPDTVYEVLAKRL